VCRAIRLLWSHRTTYAFLLPFAICFSLFTLWPLANVFLTSVQHVGYLGNRWVGLLNYQHLLADPVFWRALINTGELALAHAVVVMTLALGIAVVTTGLPGRVQTFIRAAFYLPTVASAVVLSIVWLWILNPVYGLFNFLLGKLGVPRIAWLGDPHTALFGIFLVLVTFTLGVPIILFIAGLNAIPDDLYDAAGIDGAGAWQKFRHISLPLLKRTLAFVLITSTISTFQVFVLVTLLTHGGPANATQTIVFLIWQRAFMESDFGYASSAAVVLLGVSLVTAIVQLRLVEGGDADADL
jgi:multiple sugar transport system permease protein